MFFIFIFDFCNRLYNCKALPYHLNGIASKTFNIDFQILNDKKGFLNNTIVELCLCLVKSNVVWVIQLVEKYSRETNRNQLVRVINKNL